jgi:hypothetical protein
MRADGSFFVKIPLTAQTGCAMIGLQYNIMSEPTVRGQKVFLFLLLFFFVHKEKKKARAY